MIAADLMDRQRSKLQAIVRQVISDLLQVSRLRTSFFGNLHQKIEFEGGMRLAQNHSIYCHKTHRAHRQGPDGPSCKICVFHDHQLSYDNGFKHRKKRHFFQGGVRAVCAYVKIKIGTDFEKETC